MVVHLKLADYLAMVEHARGVAPIEDCGLLGGTIDGDVKNVEKVFSKRKIYDILHRYM